MENPDVLSSLWEDTPTPKPAAQQAVPAATAVLPEDAFDAAQPDLPEDIRSALSDPGFTVPLGTPAESTEDPAEAPAEPAAVEETAALADELPPQAEAPAGFADTAEPAPDGVPAEALAEPAAAEETAALADGLPPQAEAPMYAGGLRPQTFEAAPQPEKARQPAPAMPPSPPQRPQRGGLPGWAWLLIGIGSGLVLGILISMSIGRLLGVSRMRLVTEAGESPSYSAVTPTERTQENLLDRVPQADHEGVATEPSEVYQNNVDAVVGVFGEAEVSGYWGQSGTETSAGTGFILTDDGYILTNYHVVKDCDNLTVRLFDEREFPATLIGYEAGTSDVALLKIDAQGLQTVTLGDSDSALVGEQVCTIGNPLGRLTHSLTVGYLSAKDRIVNSDGTSLNMLQTDCVINAGNSGGPLFNMRGEVIGITTAKYAGMTYSGTSIEGIGFVIPINDIKPLLNDLTSYGAVRGRPYLGVTVMRELPEGDYPAGVYVSSVNKGGCAEKAGLQADDIILELDGNRVTDYDSLSTVMSQYHAGDSVEITVWRDGEELKLPATFDERPPDPSISSGETLP